jgi:CO dehydrogenase nickel-insertion accessory protein CooC1
MKKVKITISGNVGTGKNAITGVIEEALRLHGIPISSIVDTTDNRSLQHIIDEPIYHEAIDNIRRTVTVDIEIVQTNKTLS